MEETIQLKKSYSKNKAMIYEVPLDESSGYTHIYLTSVVHNDVKELRRRLKRQFSLINSNGTVPIEEYEKMENIDSFEDEIKDINLEENNGDMIEPKNELNLSNVFSYAFGVGTLITLVQLSFLLTIIKEYFSEPINITSDPELITIRILAFVTLSLYLWIEYLNGRKKLNHAVYQGFLYQSPFKRIVSGFFGSFQMFTAFACYYACGELLKRNEGVIECVVDFSSLVIIIELDDWFGDYFINTSKDMKVYSRGYIIQIWCVDRDQVKKYTLLDGIEDLICILVFVIITIPLYRSLAF